MKGLKAGNGSPLSPFLFSLYPFIIIIIFFFIIIVFFFFIIIVLIFWTSLVRRVRTWNDRSQIVQNYILEDLIKVSN
jgi:hypothetical protein